MERMRTGRREASRAGGGGTDDWELLEQGKTCTRGLSSTESPWDLEL